MNNENEKGILMLIIVPKKKDGNQTESTIGFKYIHISESQKKELAKILIKELEARKLKKEVKKNEKRTYV